MMMRVGLFVGLVKTAWEGSSLALYMSFRNNDHTIRVGSQPSILQIRLTTPPRQASIS